MAVVFTQEELNLASTGLAKMIDDDYSSLAAIGPWAPSEAKGSFNLRILRAKELTRRIHEMKVELL